MQCRHINEEYKFTRMIYQFFRNTLDTEQYQLWSGDRQIPVDPLVFDLLVYLIAHRDRVVSRNELLENLWTGKIVTDSALGARLRDARKAVNDSGRKQAIIRTIHGRGYQFVADVKINAGAIDSHKKRSIQSSKIGLSNQGPVEYCRSADGVNIAYATVGKGPPLVVTGSWMTHLKEDWKNPNWGPYLSHLAEHFNLIRYDQRGNGMSDWDNVDISFSKMVDDLTAVINNCPYKKVAIFGPSQAASVSITYARRYPEKVSALVLHGGYSRGKRRRGYPGCEAESEALVTLIRQSWGNENPAIRHAYTSMMMPDATKQEADWFNAFQKNCGPGENIARFREMFDDIDIVNLLGDIRVPTLVAHNLGDSVSPISEGRLLASKIPSARMVTFDSKNHMMFENEPEFGRFIKTVVDFLNDC